MKAEELKKIIEDNKGVKEFNVIFNDGRHEKKRLFISDQGHICYFPKGKRSYGYIMYHETISNITICKPIIVDTLKVVKNFLNNVVKYLTASGLWVNIKEDYIKILSQGDDYLKTAINLDFSEQRKFLESTIGVSSFHVDDIVTSALKGIKQINYDKYERTHYRNIIGEQIRNKEGNFRYHWVNGYDCSVQISKDNVGNLFAWYSEEYRGCGNGHYYFALDERRAIFVEDD